MGALWLGCYMWLWVRVRVMVTVGVRVCCIASNLIRVGVWVLIMVWLGLEFMVGVCIRVRI